MSDNRSDHQNQSMETPVRKLIEELLAKGYPQRLIADDAGVDVKKVNAIKAAGVLPEILVGSEDSKEWSNDSRHDTTHSLPPKNSSDQADATEQEEIPADWPFLTEEELAEIEFNEYQTFADINEALPKQNTSAQGDTTAPAFKTNGRPELTQKDLEEEVLDRSGVIDQILRWQEEEGLSADDRHSIGSALDEAQVDASKAHRKKGQELPIRLRKHSGLKLHRFALCSLGRPGRGCSSMYRVIKEQQQN